MVLHPLSEEAGSLTLTWQFGGQADERLDRAPSASESIQRLLRLGDKSNKNRPLQAAHAGVKSRKCFKNMS